ncbi:MAG: ribose 5-phosphate isomerase B [Candidatus Woesearchaeota archaeon]|nr:ribose 5-phosphate isomerase B [Candidatus Woesearchaeota archaeon]
MKKSKGFIVLGSDHAGFRLKEAIKAHLVKKRTNIVDVGVYCEQPADYPDIAKRLVWVMKKKEGNKGMLICGTGTGMCMAANRYKGIRASVAYDIYSAEMARRDNDANVLCLRGRGIDAKKQVKLADIWLNTAFSGIARHSRRIRKLDR